MEKGHGCGLAQKGNSQSEERAREKNETRTKKEDDGEKARNSVVTATVMVMVGKAGEYVATVVW